MKNKSILFIAVVALLLHGCFIKSIHPFYFDKDVVFDQEIIGSWMDQDSGQWQIKQFTKSQGFMQGDTIDASYLVEFCDSDGNKTTYHTHLFVLGKNQYLDFFPLIDELFGDNLAYNSIIPSHSLAKFHIKDQDNISVSFFNEEWLRELFEQNRVKISHEMVKMENDYDAYILTASTDELQRFIRKYGNDRLAFQSNMEDDYTFYLTRTK